MAIFAHINQNVIYKIDDKQEDEKAEYDIEINRLNGPHFSVTLNGVSGDTLGLTNNGSFYVELFNLIEPGDLYDKDSNLFTINNDKFKDERKINSYFEYQQYLNELKAVENGLSCEDGINSQLFYYKGENGEVFITEPNLYLLPKAGTYEYQVNIINDGDNEYHNFDMTDALLDKATISANNTLSICGYSLKEVISPNDIEEI